MKLLLILSFLTVFGSVSVEAKPPAKKSKLGTDFSFEDQLIRGRYQFSDQAMADVENEKGLEDLLGVRKHFKDRLNESMGRY